VLTIPPSGANDDRTGDLNVQASLTITGAGAASTIVDGNAIDRIFLIEAPVSLSLDGVTLRNGITPVRPPSCGVCFPSADPGSAILSTPAAAAASVTLTNSTIRDSMKVFGGGSALAVQIAGALTVTNSTIGPDGSVSGGSLTMTGSTVTDSSASGSTATVMASTYSHGVIDYEAGNVTGSSFVNNTAACVRVDHSVKLSG
jgi:hypothetical protein